MGVSWRETQSKLSELHSMTIESIAEQIITLENTVEDLRDLLEAAQNLIAELEAA